MGADVQVEVSRPRAAGGRPNAARVAEISSAIVNATIEAFSTHGADFSMDQIALRAGVSKQAIYRRWPGKIDLLIHAIDTVLDEVLTFEASDAVADPVESLRALAWHSFGKDQWQSHRLSIFLQAEALGDGRLQSRTLGWRMRISQVFEERLAAIHAVRQMSPTELELQADILIELLRGATAKLGMMGEYSPSDQRRAFDARWEAFRRMMLL